MGAGGMASSSQHERRASTVRPPERQTQHGRGVCVVGEWGDFTQEGEEKSIGTRPILELYELNL